MHKTNIPFWMKRNMEMIEAESVQADNHTNELEQSTTEALVELADLQDKADLSIEDLTSAVLELAKIIGGK